MRVQYRTLVLGFIAMPLFLTRTTPAQVTTSESASRAIERVLSAHGRQWANGEIKDSVADGKITFFGVDGQRVTFDFSLLRKGNTQVQRVVKETAGELKQGTDGLISWESIPAFYTPSAQGRALQMIESQTSRSVQRLLNYQNEGLILRDLGIDKENVIEAVDQQGRRTNYYIDPSNDLITKLEFVVGQVKDPFGAAAADLDTYVFSDNRLVQGALTPFKIERYSGRNKIEEMQFSSVRYNVGLRDSDFHR